MSVRNVQTGQMEPPQEQFPIERAKQFVQANPCATINEIAKAAGVGRATAHKAKKLVAAEINPNPEPEPKPEPVDPEREREKFRATVQKTYTSLTKQWLDKIGFTAMQEIMIEEGHAWSGRYRVS